MYMWMGVALLKTQLSLSVFGQSSRVRPGAGPFSCEKQWASQTDSQVTGKTEASFSVASYSLQTQQGGKLAVGVKGYMISHPQISAAAHMGKGDVVLVPGGHPRNWEDGDPHSVRERSSSSSGFQQVQQQPGALNMCLLPQAALERPRLQGASIDLTCIKCS